VFLNDWRDAGFPFQISTPTTNTLPGA